MSTNDFFTRMNPAITAVLRTPALHWLLSPFLMLVTVTGRRSGRRYTIPVGYQLDAAASGLGVTVLVAEAGKKQWWRNYLEERPVEVRVRGVERLGSARVVRAEASDYRPRVEGTLRRVPRLDRVFGIEFDRTRGLDDSQVAHLAREIAVLHISLSERDAQS